MQHHRIETTITELYRDANNDYLKMMANAGKRIFKPLQPTDFSEVYLAISKQQGEGLKQLIKENNLRHIVEFGTSFGISTLFLAQGVLETGGYIITTELIESKARKAVENFEKAGVEHLIEVRVGDALKTLSNHKAPIDMLLLDGWKDLYLPIFLMLEPNFHPNTIVYVDNADMGETQKFLNTIQEHRPYHLQVKYNGKVVLIHIK